MSSEKKGRSKSRARSKSPFRSFRWPKKPKPEAAEAGSYSDDEDNIKRPFGKSLFLKKVLEQTPKALQVDVSQTP